MLSLRSRALYFLILGFSLLHTAAEAIKVHSIAAIVKYPHLQEKFSIISNQFKKQLENIFNKENDKLTIIKPQDMHLSLVMFELLPEHWDETIPSKTAKIINTVIEASPPLSLPFKRTAFLPGVFLLEYDNKNFINLKRDIVNAIKKSFPQAVIGFPDEYFPHISLAYFNPASVSIPFDPLEQKPIITEIKGTKLSLPIELVPALKINKTSPISISHEYWESDFIK